MENLRFEEEKIIKDIRNLNRPKKEQNGTTIKDVRNLFRLKTEVKGINYIVIRNIRTLFEYEKEEENYDKPVRINNLWGNNYIEYKSNGDENKILSVEEYLDKIRPYLRYIVNDLKQSNTWKIQLTITFNFTPSKDDYDEEHVMLSKSDNRNHH